MYVVYFDQQTYTFSCIGIIKNDEKGSKIIKTITFFIMCRRPSGKAQIVTWGQICFLAFKSDFQMLGWDSPSSTFTVFSTSRVFDWKSASQRLR